MNVLIQPDHLWGEIIAEYKCHLQDLHYVVCAITLKFVY